MIRQHLQRQLTYRVRITVDGKILVQGGLGEKEWREGITAQYLHYVFPSFVFIFY